jgi:hypothetical protein
MSDSPECAIVEITTAFDLIDVQVSLETQKGVINWGAVPQCLVAMPTQLKKSLEALRVMPVLRLGLHSRPFARAS